MAILQDHSFWRHHIGVLFAAFLIVGLSRLIGEFGDAAAITNVLLQSIVLVTIALPLQTAFAVLMARYCTLCSTRAASLIGCVLAAIPSTALSMNALWISGLVVGSDATRDAFWVWLKATYPAGLVLHATLGSMLWMVLSFRWWKSRLPEERQPEASTETDTATSADDLEAPPDFFKRLSPKTIGQLWALSAERHYVRVATEAGEELLLMRLSDAVEQCHAMTGLQVHRSHWVHRAGIEKLVRTNGKMCVELKNGTRLPVSRSHQAEMARFADDIGFSDAS